MGTGPGMTDEENATWRDEDRLPLSELERAMGASAADGQVDDLTGHDSGQEIVFGHDADAAEAEQTPGATDDQRTHRPSTTGRTGPH